MAIGLELSPGACGLSSGCISDDNNTPHTKDPSTVPGAPPSSGTIDMVSLTQVSMAARNSRLQWLYCVQGMTSCSMATMNSWKQWLYHTQGMTFCNMAAMNSWLQWLYRAQRMTFCSLSSCILVLISYPLFCYVPSRSLRGNVLLSCLGRGPQLSLILHVFVEIAGCKHSISMLVCFCLFFYGYILKFHSVCLLITYFFFLISLGGMLSILYLLMAHWDYY